MSTTKTDETVTEAAWHLLDAIQEASHAQGLDEKQHARWDVTRCGEALRAALLAQEEEA